MDATFLRALQERILADPDLAPIAALDSPKWLRPPTFQEGKSAQAVVEDTGEPNPDYIDSKEAARRDAQIARALNVPSMSAAIVGRALRGPWGDEAGV